MHSSLLVPTITSVGTQSHLCLASSIELIVLRSTINNILSAAQDVNAYQA